MEPPTKANEEGSAFLEAIIALAIISGVLAISYRAVGDSLLRNQAAQDKQRAVLIAQSRLAAIGADTPLEPGESNGVDGEYVWRVTVEPNGETNAFGRLMDVSVFVSARDKSKDLVILRQLELAPPSLRDAG